MLATTTATEVADGTAIGFYLVYAAVAVGLVVYLARTLRANGEVFLRDVFEDNDLAGAVNHLLVIGFYLLNLGYALLVYQLRTRYGSLIDAFNQLVGRTALLLLSLGVVHLFNMWVFWRIRARGMGERRQAALPPPPPYAPIPGRGPGLWQADPTPADG